MIGFQLFLSIFTLINGGPIKVIRSWEHMSANERKLSKHKQNLTDYKWSNKSPHDKLPSTW